jgi:hypothetical protein
VYARAWRLASVPPRLALPRSVLLPRVHTDQAITAPPRRSVVHTATIIMPPTTAAYPRHNGAVASNRKAAAPPGRSYAIPPATSASAQEMIRIPGGTYAGDPTGRRINRSLPSPASLPEVSRCRPGIAALPSLDLDQIGL